MIFFIECPIRPWQVFEVVPRCSAPSGPPRMVRSVRAGQYADEHAIPLREGRHLRLGVFYFILI